MATIPVGEGRRDLFSCYVYAYHFFLSINTVVAVGRVGLLGNALALSTARSGELQGIKLQGIKLQGRAATPVILRDWQGRRE